MQDYNNGLRIGDYVVAASDVIYEVIDIQSRVITEELVQSTPEIRDRVGPVGTPLPSLALIEPCFGVRQQPIYGAARAVEVGLLTRVSSATIQERIQRWNTILALVSEHQDGPASSSTAVQRDPA